MKWLVALLVCSGMVACGDDDEPRIDKEVAALFEGVGIRVEATDRLGAYTRVAGLIEQPVDHNDPASLTFTQRLIIFHGNTSVPTVVSTEGYALTSASALTEVTALLGANEVKAEHRGFGYSTFEDITKVTYAQAAADHHRVVEALRGLYEGGFVATGASKGGQAALAYRHFYPDDLVGTVAYVAPRVNGVRDPAFLPFIDTLGDQPCKDRLQRFQRDALTSPRRERLASALDDALDDLGVHSRRLGVDRILELAVREERFTFWQYTSATFCLQIPDVGSSDDDEVLRFLDSTNFFIYATDEGLENDRAYAWQAAAEAGYPEDDHTLLADVIRYNDPPTPHQWLEGLELGIPAYDGSVTQAIADELAGAPADVVLVYGETDPWTAGAFAGARRYVAPAGNHYATLRMLAEADRTEANAIINGWVGR